MRYLGEGYRNYHSALQHFVGRNFTSYVQYFSLANLPLLFQLKALQKHYPSLSGYFRDPVSTANALRYGALWTGDLGRLDAVGNMAFSDA